MSRSASKYNDVKLASLNKYLMDAHWETYYEHPGRWIEWSYLNYGIMVPVDEDQFDYPEKISNVLQTLSDVERRPQDDIIEDIKEYDHVPEVREEG